MDCVRETDTSSVLRYDNPLPISEGPTARRRSIYAGLLGGSNHLNSDLSTHPLHGNY